MKFKFTVLEFYDKLIPLFHTFTPVFCGSIFRYILIL